MIVREVGFEEARTTKVGIVEFPPDPFEVHTTVHVYQRSEYDRKPWLEYAIDILKTNPIYFHLWGHSWEIEKFDLWDELEKLFKYLKEHHSESLHS